VFRFLYIFNPTWKSKKLKINEMEEPELLEACASGDVGRVKACLYLRRAAKGEAILAVDAKQRTPLHLATIHGKCPPLHLDFYLYFFLHKGKSTQIQKWRRVAQIA
jgi:hypothetical protein